MIVEKLINIANADQKKDGKHEPLANGDMVSNVNRSNSLNAKPSNNALLTTNDNKLVLQNITNTYQTRKDSKTNRIANPKGTLKSYHVSSKERPGSTNHSMSGPIECCHHPNHTL
jgi:hypothetical protein